MSSIKILPENLANQIAAGEVIERPASVVKELVENAIDAGASHVSVQVEGNGTRLIRVIDDGQGMDQDDLLLCLERHATSKISTVDELGAIRSLGFRGEALPSIASVARLNITSKIETVQLGSQVEIRFGKVVKVHDMGAAQGTTIEVRDLFGNVPARKKFLKTAKTELAHVEEILRNYALVRHDLGFSLTINGKESFAVDAQSDTPLSRCQHILGRSREKTSLIQVGREEADNVEGGVGVFGFLLPPESTPATTARLRLFVNGRVVRDRMIAHGIAEGLAGYLMKGRKASGVLFLQVAPESVDVNVHPTKQEVRFHRRNQVHQAVVASVSQAMLGFQTKSKEELFKQVSSATKKYEPIRPGNETHAVAEPRPVYSPQPLEAKGVADLKIRPDEPEEVFVARARSESPKQSNDAVPASDILAGEEISSTTHTSEPIEVEGGLRYVGQVLATYLLCETSDGLLAIDQHAAHERLLFEKLKKQFQDKKMASQSLLFPKVLDCSPKESEHIQQYAEEIAALGIELEDFGGESMVLKAVPAILAHAAPEEVLAGVFAQLAGGGNSGKRIDDILADMACKAAIKAGQVLNEQEVQRLIEDMLAADIFSHCPHGRPVAKHFSEADIKKWFYRG